MYEINFIRTCVKIFYYCETNIIFFSNKSEKHLRSSMERGLHVIYMRSHVRWIILNIFPKKMYVFKLYIIHFRYRIYLILFIYKQLKRDIFPLIFVFFFHVSNLISINHRNTIFNFYRITFYQSWKYVD